MRAMKLIKYKMRSKLAEIREFSTVTLSKFNQNSKFGMKSKQIKKCSLTKSS